VKRLLARWNLLGTGKSLPARLARLVIYGTLLFIAFECTTAQFLWPEQAVLGVITIVLTFAIHKISDSELVTLALMFASVSATLRYGYWRFSTVAAALFDGTQHLRPLDIFFMLMLLMAESYAFLILFLGFLQTVRPLKRKPVPLPADVEEWPDVDILVPTYNEPLAIVRSTVFAAINMDYPPDKMHVYVCDDGKRPEFAAFCESVDVGYITRKGNAHAKAGNINHALTLMDARYVAIFDCDHVPTRSFLQMTLGWFGRDERLAMLQTPHFFYSPDPFERNLSHFKIIPNEGELFYGVLQDGNDLWNATFFCGSCAVLRRTALDEIGGIAVETVTEDAHTSLRMQTKGWNTAYINIPQAAGLATESLSSHVGQRIRWARGMVQILRTDNPLTAKGLKWPQRICYLNAMMHFLYAVPRLVFLTAPLVYMLAGLINIPGYWLAIFAYSMPHLLLANVVNFRVQGKYRYSFWNEVYETVLAPYILMPTLLALFNPKLGKFNVTAKGGLVSESYFDRKIARPYVWLILANIAGLIMVPIRILYLDPGRPGTVVMNAVWILFNLVILGTANAAAIEAQQLRNNVRIDLRVPLEIRLSDGMSLFGESVDLSLSGSSIQLEEEFALSKGSAVTLVFPLRDQEAAFPAIVVGSNGKSLRMKYEELTLKQEELLTLVLYSRADTWLSRNEQRAVDRPLHSFLRMLQLSVRGIRYACFGRFARKPGPAFAGARATASLIFFCLLLAHATSALGQPKPGARHGAQASVQRGDAADAPDTAPEAAAAGAPVGQGPGTFHDTLTLGSLGNPDGLEFRGVDSTANIEFTMPENQVVQQATLNLHYGFSPGLLPQISHMNVLVNGTMVATLPAPVPNGQAQLAMSTTLTLPAELLARTNTLSLQFIGHYTRSCEDPSNTTLWARVSPNTTIDLAGSSIALANDLKQLPMPFFDGQVSTAKASIPFLFLSPPSLKAVQAAGVLSSWFGVRAKSRTLSFPVTVGGTVPRGNVVLFAGDGSNLPPSLAIDGGGPRLAVRANPSDPYGKVLVIEGDDDAQLLTAVRSVVLGDNLLQGAVAHIQGFALPQPRKADDAPLWISTEHPTPLWMYSNDHTLQSDGSSGLRVYVRVPPDLYFGDRKVVPLDLDYRYNAVSIANNSTLRATMNGGLVNELRLPQQNNPHQQLATTLQVPMIDMRPFSNTLLFNFYFQIAKKGYCQDTPPIDLQGAILRSSYLDVTGVPHWAAMPNLELFSNAGFPFTRYADLSQTIAVLPSIPSATEIEVYLNLLSFFGEQTGYPALRVSTADASSLGQDADYLILGTQSDQPAFTQLGDALPVTMNSDGLTVRDTDNLYTRLRHAWWQVAQLRPNWWWKATHGPDRNGLVASIGEFPDALLEGIESPWHKHRSVVTIALRNDESADAFTNAFLGSSTSSAISDSVSVLHGTDFTSYRLDDSFYRVGSLPWYAYLRYRLLEYPWLIVLFAFLLGLLVVPWMRARLDQRQKDRLEVGK
jgi:cellulose synthase (UDP-forming)